MCDGVRYVIQNPRNDVNIMDLRFGAFKNFLLLTVCEYFLLFINKSPIGFPIKIKSQGTGTEVALTV